MDTFINLSNLLFMWGLGIVCTLGIIVLIIIASVERYKSKIIKLPVVKIILGIFFVLGLWLALPFYLEPIAVVKFGTPSAINILRFSSNISVVPSVKSGLYYELSRNYAIAHKGQKAIDAYEKAVEIAKKENKMEKGLICPVYFWKGDSKKIQEVCYPSMIALDYLKAKEYGRALENINISIEKYESESRKYGICASHAIRAAIYKQMGDKKEYKNDYDIVIKTCPEEEKYKQYMEADDILDVYLGGREINNYEF